MVTQDLAGSIKKSCKAVDLQIHQTQLIFMMNQKEMYFNAALDFLLTLLHFAYKREFLTKNKLKRQ